MFKRITTGPAGALLNFFASAMGAAVAAPSRQSKYRTSSPDDDETGPEAASRYRKTRIGKNSSWRKHERAVRIEEGKRPYRMGAPLRRERTIMNKEKKRGLLRRLFG